MSDIMPVPAVENVLKRFLVDGGKEKFSHSFGNVRDYQPDFDIMDELPIWQEAAKNIGIEIDIEVVDGLRIEIRKLVSESL